MSLAIGDMIMAYATCKAVSGASILLGAYIGERELSERFVREVYLQKKPPPGLHSVVTSTLIVHLILVSACLCAVIFAMFVRRHAPLDMITVASWVALDASLITVASGFTGAVMAQNISNQTYFNYRLEGLRAIRAMRRIFSYAFAPLALFPVSGLMVPQARIETFGRTLAQALAQF